MITIDMERLTSRGMTVGDDVTIDWSSRNDDGTYCLDVSQGTGGIAVDLSREQMAELRDMLTITLAMDGQ